MKVVEESRLCGGTDFGVHIHTERNNKYTCTAVEINDGTWKIEYTGEKTLKKYPQPIGLKQ